MHLIPIALGLLVGLALIGLGYALRGKIRKEIAVAETDALKFASRLDAARLRGEAAAYAEAKQVAADIRAAVDKAASKI